MKITVKNKNSLLSKLKKLPSAVVEATKDTLVEMTETTKARAVENLNNSIYINNGELVGSIQAEVVENGQGELVGRVWSDKEHAIYREFGTGQKGANSPKQLPPNVVPSYRMTPWFIPANKTKVDLHEAYGFIEIDIQGQKFYRTTGQPARPFLYPAFLQALEMQDEMFDEHFKERIGEL